MGLDRKLFVSATWTSRDVFDIVKKEFDPNAFVETTDYITYSQIHFTYEGETRTLHAHMHYHVGGFVGLLLDIGHWGKSDVIMTALAERLGGFYQPMDSENAYQEFAGPDRSNDMIFWSELALKEGHKFRNVDEFSTWVKSKKLYSQKP